MELSPFPLAVAEQVCDWLLHDAADAAAAADCAASMRALFPLAVRFGAVSVPEESAAATATAAIGAEDTGATLREDQQSPKSARHNAAPAPVLNGTH